MSEFRILSIHNIRQISEQLNKDRGILLSRFEQAIRETQKFAQASASAIGDISYREAVDAIIEMFGEQMRKNS